MDLWRVPAGLELFLPLCQRQASCFGLKLGPAVLCVAQILGFVVSFIFADPLWSVVANLISWVQNPRNLVHSSVWERSLNEIRCSLILS